MSYLSSALKESEASNMCQVKDQNLQHGQQGHACSAPCMLPASNQVFPHFLSHTWTAFIYPKTPCFSLPEGLCRDVCFALCVLSWLPFALLTFTHPSHPVRSFHKSLDCSNNIFSHTVRYMCDHLTHLFFFYQFLVCIEIASIFYSLLYPQHFE